MRCDITNDYIEILFEENFEDCDFAKLFEAEACNNVQVQPKLSKKMSKKRHLGERHTTP